MLVVVAAVRWQQSLSFQFLLVPIWVQLSCHYSDTFWMVAVLLFSCLELDSDIVFVVFVVIGVCVGGDGSCHFHPAVRVPVLVLL